MNTIPVTLLQPILTLLDTAVFDEKEAYETAYQSVSEQRRKKVDSYRLCKDKHLSLGAGVLLEQGLQRMGITEYSLAYGEHGKPYLTDSEDVFFSLSHSGTLAACVFYKREIGLDIQKIKPVSEKLIKKVTTDTEFSYLINHSEDERKLAFFRLWTAKESYMKYLGSGLSLSPKRLEVMFGKTLTIKHDGNAVSVAFDEQTLDGYALTVCYEK